MHVPHLPVLRFGKPYESLDKIEVKDHRTGEVKATVSTVNAGIVRKDLQRLDESRAALKKFSVAQLLECSARAGDLFLNGTLPLGDKGHTQSPRQYIEALSATSGLPHVMVQRNIERIHAALTNAKTVLNGLTRGLDLSILDRGYGEQSGTRIGLYPATQALGLVMPSNSPAVNSLWLPAIALKTPVILKPGREEPWTPYRLIQAFISAGVPREAFGFYPTDHEGAREILKTCGRALLFGDKNTTAPYAHNPAIQIHGPGCSKVLIGDDCIEHWRDYLDVMVSSISDNGGRSCINASAIVVPKYAAEIAEALAQRLGPIQPAKVDDPQARLAGFANPKMADFIDSSIEEGLKISGAIEVTAKYRTPSDSLSSPKEERAGERRPFRPSDSLSSSEEERAGERRPSHPSDSLSSSEEERVGERRPSEGSDSSEEQSRRSRKVTFDGGVYLRPTIVLCDSFKHPLANKEFLCPYASVVTVPQSMMLDQIGPSLAVAAITKDAAFIDQLQDFQHIERLSIGPMSTMNISWDQPHEGNLFEFLWKRRSIERVW